MNIRPVVIAAFLGALGASVAGPQPEGGDFKITRSTIDSGGGVSLGGELRLVGVIGQPDASGQAASGGQFQLTGGFWGEVAGRPLADHLFADGFEG